MGSVIEEPSWEEKQPCELLNAIFSRAVNQQVMELHKEKWHKCHINQPLGRKHGCLKMTNEEA